MKSTSEDIALHIYRGIYVQTAGGRGGGGRSKKKKKNSHTHINGCTALPIVQTGLLFLLPEETSGSY